MVCHTRRYPRQSRGAGKDAEPKTVGFWFSEFALRTNSAVPGTPAGVGCPKTAWMPGKDAGWNKPYRSFCTAKTSKIKIRMDADFYPRKG
jgi:hypothetical protein